ncbi:alpha-hydroxy acid oxidase [Marinactinospora thermotolerans]|uniref:L-lactate dehydrogenase (Cytochrome) n=1 Tax=Marinactinospora thermotolerans DSM 45154 TaxID=1122192 RepID=A0A1T4K8Q2_9ACTN|nr:alpha-hydroxy acid oxidase [Marinactinospora thermotolerans]SJZ38727.1 L-lactate dehydrogenase (cytochrome) [Marinactinospora thermotolerans DSM 45154]
MRLSDLGPLIRLRRPEPDARRRNARSCHNVTDFRALARRRLPRAVFDYIDGGADRESGMAANSAAFERHELLPRVLRDVSRVSTSTTLLGAPARMPLGLAPTGFTRMFHHEGEHAVARAAAAADVPYALSTMGTVCVEDLAAHEDADLWFQLYIWRDRGLTTDLVDRAAEAGYRVLVITVDTPVTGMRERDLRSGFTIPPTMGPATLVDLARRPGWWLPFLASEPITFANVPPHLLRGTESAMAFAARQFDPSVTWEDIAPIAARWPGPVLLKGVLRSDDALRARDMGLAGVVLSNHGGRQLDRTVTPLDALPGVRAAVGPAFTVLVDSGVRHGSDVALAIALGADAALIGRPYLYALAAAGDLGVARLIALLEGQLRRTMQLLGVTSVEELRRHGGELVSSRPTD